MKKISIVLVTALIIFSCNEKKETAKTNTDWFVDNLKGEVQKVVETPYKTDSTGKIGDMDSCCIEIAEYDSAGNIVRVASQDSKGTVTHEETFTKYDNGLFKEIVTTEKGKVTHRISVKIDKDGKYSTAEEYDSTGKLSSFYKDIVQNDYNQLTSMKQYNPDSSLKSSFTTDYDKQIFKGQINKDSSGKETSRSSAKVDDKGNQVEFTRTSTMKDSTTKKDSTTTKVTKYTYQSYDEQGNWTQRTTLDETGKATKIVKREITYYKK
jgi:hypothetical protein